MEGILNASYGDRPGAPARRGRAIEHPLVQDDPDQNHLKLPQPYRPPFWDSKLYGEPYGDFNRNRLRSAQGGGVAAAMRGHDEGRPETGQPPRAGRVDDKASRQLPAQAWGAGPAGGREGDEEAPGPPPYQQQGIVKPGRVQKLEDEMRDRLDKMKKLHKDEQEALVQAFASMDVRHTKTVSVAEFIKVWGRLGVKLEKRDAALIFNKYGQNKDGRMPYRVFVDGLRVGSARLLAKAGEVRQGAFTDPRQGSFLGKIIYPPCRKGVYPPTNWDPQLAFRSNEVPSTGLDLQFVYGYAGVTNLNTNLFYTSTAEVVYYTAALGIVYNRQRHTQRFFRGHDDDIKSIALGSSKDLVATGQVGKYPVVCVWRAQDCEELARLKHSAVRGIIALAFSPDQAQLVSCGSDNNHTIHIWDWQRRRILSECKGANGGPPMVYGIRFNPYVPDEFVSWGVNHLKIWNKTTTTYMATAGVFGSAGTHSVMSCTHLKGGGMLTGMPDGGIAVWKGERIQRVVRAHAKGPPITRPDGGVSYGGLRCLRLRDDEKVVLSGGADGQVIAWDVTNGPMKDTNDILGTIALKSPYANTTAPMLRALDSYPGSSVFIAGTHRADIWEVDQSPSVLIYGHSADLYGVAWNPTRPSEFTTACESERIFTWDSATRHMVRTAALGGVPCRSVAYSPDGAHLAVGMRNGGINIVEGPTLQAVKWLKTFNSAVDDLKYSPCGKYLAAGSHDQYIDIYLRGQSYARMKRCGGHSSTVTHLDWSVDSRLIMSNCMAYEMLYFDVHTGQQVKQNQRDTAWATYTCILGFPVMGIWPEGADGTDINSVHRSHSQKYCLTADDMGEVKIFNYPCVMHRAPHRAYRGHSSHVMNIRWSPDDRMVVSVGGKDRAVFQWTTLTHKVVQSSISPPYPPDEPQKVWVAQREGAAKRK